MPVQLRSNKRLLTESESDESMSESVSETQSEMAVTETMEMPTHTQAVLTKILRFYGPPLTNYLKEYSNASVPAIMYVPFLATLGVGPNIRDEDTRPPELKGVPLYDIMKGSAYTALIYAKHKLLQYVTFRETKSEWPETQYPPQASSNVPWFTRVDALEARRVIEDGIDWCSKSKIHTEGPLQLQHGIGLWRALETALQISALLDCLRVYECQQARLFRGLRQVRYASRLHDYYALAKEPETGTTINSIAVSETTPESTALNTGGLSVESQNITSSLTAGVKRSAGPSYPGVAAKTVRIVRPIQSVYDDTRMEVVAAPHTMVAITKK